jgi:hypothetical protein
MKYGFMDYVNVPSAFFSAYVGANGEYDSPYFDEKFRLHGIRWSYMDNYLIGRKEFYFLKHVVESLATSVNEIKNKGPFQIYPNPATDHLSIEIPSFSSATAVKIFNMHGQVVFSSMLSNQKTIVDVSTLMRGAYVVEVLSSDGISRQKLIKQ